MTGNDWLIWIIIICIAFLIGLTCWYVTKIFNRLFRIFIGDDEENDDTIE